jgi:hypothetical protein
MAIFITSATLFVDMSNGMTPERRTHAASNASTQSRRFGPYATIRRANEVAAYARSLGYNARVIYGGGLYSSSSPRVYYVDVWR